MISLEEARQIVAEDWRKLSEEIYREDEYASHVTHCEKLANLIEGFRVASLIAKGELDNNFTIFQRIEHAMRK